MKRITVVLLIVAMAGISSAQCSTLATFLTGGNGQSGTMFDIVNTSAAPITVSSFDQSFFGAGTATMEIYTKVGTFNGSQAIIGNWTLVGGGASVPHPLANTYYPIPISVGVTIPPGATQGWYITSTADTVAYTNGSGTLLWGTVIASDANIQVIGGNGIVYLCAGTFGGIGAGQLGRLWNGRVTYSTGGGGAAWQVNQPEASLSFGGTNAGPCSGPGVRTVCPGTVFNASLNSTLLGNGWDVGFHLGSGVSAFGGGITLPNGNVLNLDLSNPTFTLLNGGTFPPFPGPINVPVSFPVPLTLVAQMAVIDPSTIGGVRLSQANELIVSSTPPPASLPGPTTDDSSVTINLGSICGWPSSIPFYGVNYTQVHVVSNGRIMFTGAAGNTTFAPVIANGLTDQPFVGAWCDLNPGVGGNITITAPAADQLQVNYNAVPYYTNAAPNTFTVNFNATTGVVTIGSISTMGVGTANMFLGITKGNLGATNAGATLFNVSGPNALGASTDMIYNFGIEGPGLAGGANTLTFTPNGSGGYVSTGS